MRKTVMSLCVATAALMSACTDGGPRVADAEPSNVLGAAAVNAERLLNADKEPGSWLSAARTYDEQRFSPLDQVNDTNVKALGLAWFADIDTERGQESTPVIVDGVMYLTTAWSMVKAFDIKTGAKLWEYDPTSRRTRPPTPAAMW
jgi:quinohemoprotein ethanol dehydrogenase